MPGGRHRTSLSTLNVDNIGVGVELKLLLLGRELPGVGSLKYLIQLLKSAALGLWDEEVDNSGLDRTPNDEDEVSLPCNLLKGDGPCELVEETGGVDSEGGEGHTLGTLLE